LQWTSFGNRAVILAGPTRSRSVSGSSLRSFEIRYSSSGPRTARARAPAVGGHASEPLPASFSSDDPERPLAGEGAGCWPCALDLTGFLLGVEASTPSISSTARSAAVSSAMVVAMR